MKNKYEKLRERINELLPDRLKLEFGCEILLNEEKFENRNSAVIIEDSVGKPKKDSAWEANWLVMCWGVQYWIFQHNIKEILGKPLTIVDVLRALEICKPKNIHYLYPDGSFHGDEDELLCTFDLSKPLFVLENDEACVKILKLLK